MATTTTKKSRKNSPKPTNDEIFSNRENVSQNTWNSFTTTDLTNLLDQQPTFFQQPLDGQFYIEQPIQQQTATTIQQQTAAVIEKNQNLCNTQETPIQSTLRRLCNTNYKHQNNTKALNELQINVPYEIEEVRSANTKFGRRIILDFKNGLSVFLPQRYGKLSEDQIQQMNEQKLSMVYNGKQTNASGYVCHNIKFV